MIMATLVKEFPLVAKYVSAYEAFHNVTDQHKNNLACLQQHIPTALEKLQLGKDQPRFNILSIGAGNGFMDQEILKFVQEGHLNTKEEVEILNTAVEPNTEFLRQYKESIERSAIKNKGSSKQRSVNFDLKQMSFEEYAESKHDHNQYDMVHAIQSLYYVDSIESTLKHIYNNELGDKGLIACNIGNDSDLVGVTTSFASKFRPELQRKVSSNPAEDIIRVAEENSMKYEKVIVPYSVDVRSVFDESSEEGRHMLDFFADKENYRQTAEQNELKEVLKMLEDISSKDDNGRLIVTGIVNCTNELILIYKTP